MKTAVTLFSSAAVLTLAAPAAAQDHVPTHTEAIHSTGAHDGEWSGQWENGDTWRGMWNGTFTTIDGERLEGRYVGTFVGEGEFVSDDGRVLMLGESGWHEGEGGYEFEVAPHRASLPASPDGRLGYTFAEREAWLSDCRVLMAHAGGYNSYDAYYRDEADSGLIGGLLGAAVGGLAGNRISDGDRLAGTLVGAGVGGIAGAAIGSLIDNDEDNRGDTISANELYAARYCDAYLRRYEMGGGTGYHEQISYGQPVMLVQTVGVSSPVRHGHHGRGHGPECTTTVREEWVEVDAPAPRPARRSIAPRPRPAGKTVPIE